MEHQKNKPDPSLWVAHDYAAHSGHHRVFDDWFIDRCPPRPDDLVLDLGCGSGEFSARIARRVPQGFVVGVDQDTSMIREAQRHTEPNLEFIRGPADQVDELVQQGAYDLVISRAMLHWLPIERYRRCFEGVRRTLRAGGIFHSESAGAGNVADVARLLETIADQFDLDPPPAFPDAGMVFDLVEGVGFELSPEAVRTVAQRRPFSREELVAFLRSQAAIILTRQAPGGMRRKIITALVEKVDQLQRKDGTYDQTFVRLEILATRASADG